MRVNFEPFWMEDAQKCPHAAALPEAACLPASICTIKQNSRRWPAMERSAEDISFKLITSLQTEGSDSERRREKKGH